MSGLVLKYFVLKPRGHDAYAVASRRALIAYASAIFETNEVLAGQLMSWAGYEEKNAERRRGKRRKTDALPETS